MAFSQLIEGEWLSYNMRAHKHTDTHAHSNMDANTHVYCERNTEQVIDI